VVGKAILGIAAILVVAYVAFRLLIRWSNSRESPGFREIVKNPGLWRNYLSSLEDEDEAIADAASWNKSRIAKEVERYIFKSLPPGEVWLKKRVLQSLENKTHATLLEILADESLRERLVIIEGEGHLADGPILRLIKLFDGTMPEDAVPYIRAFLDAPSKTIQKNCALSLAESGHPASLQSIQELLSNDDEYVRSFVLIGLRNALDSDRLSDTVASGVLSKLEELVEKDKNVYEASNVLADLDPARASQFLTSGHIFNKDKPQLQEILRVIRENTFEVSRDRVLNLISEFQNRDMEYPNDAILGEALALLGACKVSSDRQFLKELWDDENDYVARGAGNGLLLMHDLINVHEETFRAEETVGWDGLSAERQVYLAVFMLDAEVNNGGHAQYFFNSSGDYARQALAGLNEIGLKERLAIFEEAMSYFGEAGPHGDRDQRHDQFAAIYRRHETEFNALDSKYYASKENVSVHLQKFVIENHDGFR